MSEPLPEVGASPFNPRVVLGMVLFGVAVFLALLWMIGAGMTQGPANNGGAHVGGKGLTGYAGLSQLLEKQGYAVSRVRNEDGLKGPGLVILTPPHEANGKDVLRIIADRRFVGPTILVLPKWRAVPASMLNLDEGAAKDGWVAIDDADLPHWPKELEGYDIAPRVEKGTAAGTWRGLGRSGALPDKRFQHIGGEYLVPLVADAGNSMLAAYVQDDGYYPDLAAAAGIESYGEDEGLYPLVVVAEPDLLNNWGMADSRRAMLALDLIERASAGRRGPVAFDMTLNGFKASANLLTLAFRPPFVAATICLLIAALIAGWRAFRRYGPPHVPGRAIAFGKRALVANSAGLVRRSGRLHLLAAPYATLLRERVARKLALPRHADAETTEAAIDRALAARDPAAMPFSIAAAQMRAARRPADLLRAGRTLYSLERTLKR
ncbi:hypothetical protein [Novosphingobium sp. TH158]|uniref:hypothetical protein n=1 Tax=Novosphingobium sp. TH158 TaxID=2067455 RepID=UPI000C7D401A|nr:hypothetical protein [Novosphingobium sp. TH158]PLK27300.1 hypothetical protein C0V78_10685 [Novosphingobium sp. TH158]